MTWLWYVGLELKYKYREISLNVNKFISPKLVTPIIILLSFLNNIIPYEIRLQSVFGTLFPMVPSGESEKNTVYETIFPPCDKKILKDRVFWQEVVNDLQELKEIIEPKSVSEPENDGPFQIRPPEKWWWDRAV